MCENKINNIEDIIQNIQNEPEETEKMIFFCDPILVNLKEVENLTLNKQEFNRGLKDSSYISGFYTGLINVGFDHEYAINLILTKMHSDMNIEMAKINANSNVEVSKNTPMVLEKQQV